MQQYAAPEPMKPVKVVTMSELTEEQLRIMEENRQKALERKRKREEEEAQR